MTNNEMEQSDCHCGKRLLVTRLPAGKDSAA